MHDLVIRGAIVVDGLGHDPIHADVAVSNGRIAAVGKLGRDAAEVVDAGGLALMPGIIDLHTHYDAQVTWDPTLSPSPSLGVTTAVMGNCGFGIVPSPPPLRDLIMRNLAIVEGMDLDALRAGIDWRFQSFAEYMTMLRGRGPYMNLGVLVGHSAVRTAVMGDDASARKQPTAAELAEMKRLVAEAMDQGAIGLGASYSLNHSGWGGVPMPSTISDLSEFDALVGAMGGPGRGVVEISSGPIMPDTVEGIAARYGRRIFMSTAVALYNEQHPERALGVFDACAAAQARGNELMIVKAIERGVSEEKLAKALNVDIRRIKTKRTLLDGVCPEVAEMLKDKSVDTDVFTLLRKMKPMRQIEAVELMSAMNNFTARYAHALLAATRHDDLAQPDRPKNIRGLTAEQMACMEREMDGLQREFKAVSASYGDTVLNLVVAAGYLSSLIGNPRVSGYLERHHPEILTEFKAIVAATSLEETGSGESEQPAFLD